MAFPPLRNFDHLVISVSIDFQSNSKQDVPFHRMNCLCGHLRDIFWENIFNPSASAATGKLC